MPSTPTTVSNYSNSSGGGIRDEEREREFRVYRAGVRNLVRQEDEGEQGRLTLSAHQCSTKLMDRSHIIYRLSTYSPIKAHSNDFFASRTRFFDLRLGPFLLETHHHFLLFLYPSTPYPSRSNPRELSQNANRIPGKESSLIPRTLLSIRTTPRSSRRSRESFPPARRRTSSPRVPPSPRSKMAQESSKGDSRSSEGNVDECEL